MKLIRKIYEILNLCKDFEAGYNSVCKDSMIIDYNRRRYAVNFTEITDPDVNIFNDLGKLDQYMKEGE